MGLAVLRLYKKTVLFFVFRFFCFNKMDFMCLRVIILLTVFFVPPLHADVVYIKQSGNDRSPVFTVVNDSYSPVQAKFWFSELRNLNAQSGNSVQVLVPARSRRFVNKLFPANNSPTKWSYSYKYYLGDPSSRHTNPEYMLPFESDSSFMVSQAFGGSFSHKHKHNYHAVDIGMPVGTLVRAARGGRVIEIEQRNISGGVLSDLLDKANYITILHDDGTMASYAHLRWASIRPRLGSIVRKGQVIGQSGNVGFSSGPHLHFVIRKNCGMRYCSVPFSFESGVPFKGQVLKNSS